MTSPSRMPSDGARESRTVKIWSRKRGMWYRPAMRGYTFDEAEAGVFAPAEAALHCAAVNHGAPGSLELRP